MRFFYPLLAAAAVVEAHYTFSSVLVDGKATGDWTAVRKTKNWQNNGPVTDVTSDDIRCFELSPGTAASLTANVTAGSSVGFQANPDIYHPGPLAFYMAKAPAGKTAATFDGSGPVWFKIYEEQPTVGGQSLTWSSNGLKTPSVTLPKCLPNGDYLFRIEHIGLHVAQSTGGAQFYISCGQVTVTGGGSKSPTDLVAFPGAYKATDPGILININYPVPTSYTNPGPKVFTC
ncbi:glycoside hydrolase family 61 protein [Ophiostoma piceae UAMH 11346]|uniref:lytic cellulose monooxygenase (C4-dehydrogenating) n=1 Tax=Ophiostoma piceae (strain UAMH 11346) TaxID=1262450 RepID=S3CBX6_OPHP1|nr:glycoside hydrolase family 61 protein [Ophiostoma piceae UAMH 11346]